MRRYVEAVPVEHRAMGPHCQIIYDKFHIMQHANKAVDEVRRTEFFRKGGKMGSVVKGKRWLLLSRWINLDTGKKQQLNKLFALQLSAGAFEVWNLAVETWLRN
jgi:transposase